MVLGDPSDPKGDRKAASEWELVGGMSLSRGGGRGWGDTHSSAGLARLAGVALKSLGTLEGRRWHQQGGRVLTQRPPSLGGGVILTGAPEGPGGPRGPMGPWGERDNSVMAGGGDETATPPITCPTRGVLENGDGPHSQ